MPGCALDRDVRAASIPGDDLVPVAVPRDSRVSKMRSAVVWADPGRIGLRLRVNGGNSATGSSLGQDGDQPDQNEAAGCRSRVPRP